jgi:hypothetical protein
VLDNNTGLTWQRSPDTDGDGRLTRRDKLTPSQAEALPAKLNAARFGGFSDWRLPTIKQLYSLIEFSGVDPIAVQDLQEEIRQLVASGVSILVTDHNVERTLEVVDKAYIIDHGRVIGAGSPAEIIRNEVS